MQETIQILKQEIKEKRLMRMLKFFIDMPDDWVPSNSLMREFIGGSCYADV